MVMLEQLSLLLPASLDSDEEYKGFRSGMNQTKKTVASKISGTSGVAGATCLCSSFNVPKVHWMNEAHRKDCGDLYVRFDSS